VAGTARLSGVLRHAARLWWETWLRRLHPGIVLSRAATRPARRYNLRRVGVRSPVYCVGVLRAADELGFLRVDRPGAMPLGLSAGFAGVAGWWLRSTHRVVSLIPAPSSP